VAQRNDASAGSLRPYLGFITECGETVDSSLI
jgi:hypothetical protein